MLHSTLRLNFSKKSTKENDMKIFNVIVLLMLPVVIYADNIKFLAVVIDDVTQEPISGVCVGAGFTTDNGPIWEGRFKYEHKKFFSNKNGVCEISGSSNCGTAGCYVKNPPAEYYKTQCGVPMRYKKKNLFGVWQPDNLVVTLRLQRVEHPIPLFVKQLFSRGSDSVGSNYFDIAKGQMKFDLVKGDWLPPIGKGKYPDICFTRLEREDLGMGTNFNGRTSLAYRDAMTIEFLGDGNGLIEIPSGQSYGIKIRTAPLDGYKAGYLVTKGKDKNVKYFTSSNPDRNFAFRIRTKMDADGKIVSAYYGKIYGDIVIKKPYGVEELVAAPSFMYYLNPTPLDRNLEWDMKNNLCPNPGSLSAPMP